MASQRWDGVLGLYDYRARYYSPGLGRFISADPLVPEPGNPQNLNRYAYVRNNPLKYTDPSGHIPLDWLVDGISVSLSAAQFAADPTWENAGWLALDIALAVIPYVPAGVGLVRSGGKAARAALEAASHSDETAALLERITTRAVGEAAQAFVQQAAREAEERVIREGWLGNIDSARHLAQTQRPEILPGLFRYNPRERIVNYQQHHLWRWVARRRAG